MIVERVVRVFRAGGISEVLRAVARRIRMPWARSLPLCREIVRDKTGIEMGGPSPIFARGGLLPVYPLARRLDNCNFAARTIWEGAITEGESFTFNHRRSPGSQFIAEASNLPMVPAEVYDFVLSSHMLEHSANPLRVLAEWRRLLKQGGGVVLVLPHRDGTFDHRRPITTVQHLIGDLQSGTGEADLTHVPEVLELHDLSKDPGADDYASFRARAERNPEIRSLHHHVFDTRLAINTVALGGFQIVAVELLRPYHIVVIARKPAEDSSSGGIHEGDFREVLRRSPFPTDRQ